MSENRIMENLKEYILKHKLELVGAIAGSLAGLAYWYFVGCASGKCAITSNPYISTIYGGVTGWLMFGIFKGNKEQNVIIKKQENEK